MADVDIMSFRVCPIFQVSNVTGENLDLLKNFINLLSARMPPQCDKPAEFQIDETYSVPVRTRYLHLLLYYYTIPRIVRTYVCFIQLCICTY